MTTASPARRRLQSASLLATLILSLSALGLFTGGTAHADNACSFHNIVRYSGGSYNASNGTDPGGTQIASYNIGGTYDCSLNSSEAWTFPNLTQEAFVIAPDHTVWTIWDSSSGLSSWKSFGGQCKFDTLAEGSYGIVDPNTGNPIVGGWVMWIACYAPDGSGPWFKYRAATSSGNWSAGWTEQHP
jgi:hypothetical protein